MPRILCRDTILCTTIKVLKWGFSAFSISQATNLRSPLWRLRVLSLRVQSTCKGRALLAVLGVCGLAVIHSALGGDNEGPSKKGSKAILARLLVFKGK
ncbi:hypothetical protein ACSS6W_006035 [Trichoderma asperelloides]